jgi:hypothetical protein
MPTGTASRSSTNSTMPVTAILPSQKFYARGTTKPAPRSGAKSPSMRLAALSYINGSAGCFSTGSSRTFTPRIFWIAR